MRTGRIDIAKATQVEKNGRKPVLVRLLVVLLRSPTSSSHSANANSIVLSTMAELWLLAILTRTKIVVGIIPFKAKLNERRG